MVKYCLVMLLCIWETVWIHVYKYYSIFFLCEGKRWWSQGGRWIGIVFSECLYYLWMKVFQLLYLFSADSVVFDILISLSGSVNSSIWIMVIELEEHFSFDNKCKFLKHYFRKSFSCFKLTVLKFCAYSICNVTKYL